MPEIAMNTRRLLIILATTSIVVITSTVLVESNGPGKSAEVMKPIPPITAMYLDGSIVHFDCLEMSECFADVDLGAKVKAANTPREHPLDFHLAYYADDSTLYMLLVGSAGQFLAKVNPRTRQVEILDTTPFLGGLNAGMETMVQGKLVLATPGGKISIVQDDFSVKTIDLKTPVLDILAASDARVAVICATSLFQDDNSQAKVVLVDVHTGQVAEDILISPRESSWFIVTVDQAVAHLYWLPADASSTYSRVLKAYNLAAHEEFLSVPLTDADALTYTTETAKRYQYRDVWYYSRSKWELEGRYPAMMVDMATLRPIVNPADFLKGENDATFMVSPFGDNFLIGTDSRVFVIRPTGEVVKTLALPKGWVGRDYVLLEYWR